MIGYSDRVIRPLGLILPKKSGYVKTFKDKGGNKNKLMSLRIDDNNLLEKYRTTWTKIEGLKNVELHALRVYDDRYVKIKAKKTYGDKVYTNFRGLNVPKDDVGCESFTVISIDSLLVYENKYYLQIYLGKCDYKTVNTKIIDYLDENLSGYNEK